MKRYVCTILCILICLSFAACSSTTPKHYVQREGIPRPDSIDTETGSTVLTFNPEDEEYERLYDTLLENWWLSAEGEPDTASDSQLIAVDSLKNLKTKTWRTYRQGDDNFVIFRYEDGIEWTNVEGNPITVKAVFFLIPDHVEECDNIKGYFSASESGQVGVNEGMYTFYFPDEMTDGFFHWVMHGEQDAPSEVHQPTYSQEQAMLEGFVVMQDGDVRHNAGNWFDFLEKSHSGEPANITIAQYTSGSEGTTDLYYEVSFAAGEYTVSFYKDGSCITETADTLMVEKGTYDDTWEPYDCYEAYTLNDIVLYRDQIAEPDFEGVKEIFLHAKEGEPPIKTYQTVEETDPILQLLMTARWMEFDSDDAVYGMKLLMTNRDGKELVIELDLLRGVYRYGTQCYSYGSVSDLFEALDIQNWPDSVIEEFRPFIK